MMVTEMDRSEEPTCEPDALAWQILGGVGPQATSRWDH